MRLNQRQAPTLGWRRIGALVVYRRDESFVFEVALHDESGMIVRACVGVGFQHELLRESGYFHCVHRPHGRHHRLRLLKHAGANILRHDQ